MHLHITVDADPAEVAADLTGNTRTAPRGSKMTVIRLWNEYRVALDTMLTLHCRPGEEYAKLADLSKWCVLRKLPILRRKIEADPTEYSGPPMYYETHVALPENADPKDVARIERAYRLGRSTNELRPRPGAFVTHRSDSTFIASLFAGSVVNSFHSTSLWPEHVVLDDNPGHDSWWAPIRSMHSAAK